MKRLVVSYATGRYVTGLKRLDQAVLLEHGAGAFMMPWGHPPYYNAQDAKGIAGSWPIPNAWPSHATIPYGFKAYALKAAMNAGAESILWADAAILPIRSMEPLWEKIEREGAWIHNGGWKNGQWCADSWYPEIFNPQFPMQYAPEECRGGTCSPLWSCEAHQPLSTENCAVTLDPAKDAQRSQRRMDLWREINKDIPHVVATTFGLNVKSEIGASILNEYYRLASETKAFCGPWWNSNGEREDYRKHAGAAPCGPPSTLGHRHDQSCLSIIAHRHGVKLTEGAEIFDYSDRRPDGTLHLEDQDERTILLADGSFNSGLV